MTKRSGRPLSSGEITLASQIFQDAIDYAKVRIYNRGYLPFGLQGRHTAMAPNGCIYFSHCDFKEDFSSEGAAEQMWFIHEMAHVWQNQLGYRVRWNGLKLALKGGYAPSGTASCYSDHEPGKTMSELNMEQQATVIERYFGAVMLQREDLLERVPFMLAILRDFLADPKDSTLLPR